MVGIITEYSDPHPGFLVIDMSLEYCIVLLRWMWLCRGGEGGQRCWCAASPAILLTIY